MAWEDAQGRHDSSLEEQLRGCSGCDWDHFLSLISKAWESSVGQKNKRSAQFCASGDLQGSSLSRTALRSVRRMQVHAKCFRSNLFDAALRLISRQQPTTTRFVGHLGKEAAVRQLNLSHAARVAILQSFVIKNSDLPEWAFLCLTRDWPHIDLCRRTP